MGTLLALGPTALASGAARAQDMPPAGLGTAPADRALRIAEVRLRERQVLASEMLLYGGEDGTILVPLVELGQLIGFPLEADSNGRVSGWFLRENQQVEIDPGQDSVEVAGVRRALEPGRLVSVDGVLHVSLEALDQWFSLRPVWDEGRQTLVLAPPYLLPQEEQARRAGMAGGFIAPPFDIAGFHEVPARYAALSWPHVRLDLAASRNDLGRGLGARGSAFLEGDLLWMDGRLALSGDTVSGLRTRLTLGRSDVRSQLLGPLAASLFEFGDVAAPLAPLLRRSGSGAGIRLARQPLDAVGQFDRTDLIGDAPPGWQAELYRDGALLAFQTVGQDGRYRFEGTETRFGRNRFTVLLYGPSGERREQERVIDVGREMVRPGELRYDALVLRLDRSLFGGSGFDLPGGLAAQRPDTVAEARLAYGLTSRLGFTAQAAWHQADGPAAAARGYAGGGVLLQAGMVALAAEGIWQDNGAMAGHARMTAGIGPLGLSASHEHYSAGFVSESRGLSLVALRSLSQVAVDGMLGRVGLGLAGRWFERQDGGHDRSLALRTSTSLAGISVTQRLAWRDSERAAPTAFADDRWEGATALAGSFGRTRVRMAFDYGLAPRLVARTIRAEAAYRLAQWQFTAGTRHDLFRDQGTWSLAANRDWNGIRVGADIQLQTPGHDLRGFLTLSLAFDRQPVSGDLRFGRAARLDRGSVLVAPFLDADGNGRRDAGELPVEGVTVQTQPRAHLAGSARHRGTILLEDLPVDQLLAIKPDVSRIDDPFIVARHPGYLVHPRSGSVARLDLPLVESGDLEIQVLRGESIPRAGLPVAVVSCNDPADRTAQSTAFDGRAYFHGLLPGCYHILGGTDIRSVDVAPGDTARVTLFASSEEGPQTGLPAPSEPELHTPTTSQNEPDDVAAEHRLPRQP